MARENYQARLEAVDARRVDEFQEEQNIETQAEATRRLLRRGLDDWDREQDDDDSHERGVVRHGVSENVVSFVWSAVGAATGAGVVGVVL
jgi:hypothetical protein